MTDIVMKDGKATVSLDSVRTLSISRDGWLYRVTYEPLGRPRVDISLSRGDLESFTEGLGIDPEIVKDMVEKVQPEQPAPADDPLAEAVLLAWVDAGVNPLYHRMRQSDVRTLMPTLGKMLDRWAQSKGYQ